MELTQSAFNILLDMTSIREEIAAESLSLSAHENHVPHQQSLTTQPENTPQQHIYYYNGEQRLSLTRDELLSKITERLHGKHYIWVPHLNSWKSWKLIPNLVKTVHQQVSTQSRSLHEIAVPLKTSSSQPLNTPQSTINVTGEQDVNQVSHADQDPYLSVPETVFTRFTLDLDQPQQLIPYIGWDGTIVSGGIFIKTPRVLNVGDYIQLTLKINDETFLSFEIIKFYHKPPGGHDNN